MSSEFRKLSKFCKNCGKKLVLNNSRDIERKNFCSHSCRAKTYITPEITKLAQSMANTVIANAKKAHHKENHPKWIKDRSMVKTQRTIAEFKWWRKAIYERDNYTCTQCNERGGKLTAHHKAPVVRFPMYKFEISNGITLCHACHTDVHKAANELFKTGGFCNKLKENQIAF